MTRNGLIAGLNGEQAVPRWSGRELASEELRQSTWGYALDRPYAGMVAALRTLERERIVVRPLSELGKGSTAQWAKLLAEQVALGECQAIAVFCADPGLVCCVANKVSGVRAVAVATIAQAARATLTLGANLLAIEMPGRTFFEIKQMMKTLFVAQASVCPATVAPTLTELDGYAHR